MTLSPFVPQCSYLALLAYRIAKRGFSLMASVNKSMAFWSSPEVKLNLLRKCSKDKDANKIF